MSVDSNWWIVSMLMPMSNDLIDVKENTVTVNGDTAINAEGTT